MFRFLIFLILLTFSESYAQNSVLYNQTWSLYELQLGGTIYVPSQNDFINFDAEGANILGVGNEICDIGYLGEPIIYNGQTSFEIEYIAVSPIGPQCDMYNDPEAFDALTMHGTFYTLPPTSAPKNPFNYEITEDAGALQLTITNGEGDIATYQNIPLSLNENGIENLKLIYTSDKKEIYFNGLTAAVQLDVFTLTGQKLNSVNVQNNERIKIATLSTGIYLARITNTFGQHKTFKLLKK